MSSIEVRWNALNIMLIPLNVAAILCGLASEFIGWVGFRCEDAVWSARKNFRRRSAEKTQE